MDKQTFLRTLQDKWNRDSRWDGIVRPWRRTQISFGLRRPDRILAKPSVRWDTSFSS